MHLWIWKPVSFDELSCHCRAIELEDMAVAIKLLAGEIVAAEVTKANRSLSPRAPTVAN
jgi:hypothetical protein